MDVAVRLVHPLQYRQTFGVTFFAAFILVCYVTFVSIENRKPEIESID